MSVDGRDPMTDSVKEQLSACLDGELPDRELTLLLRRIERDGELRATMTRYGLLSEALRTGRPPVRVSMDLAERVMSRIAAEPRPTMPRARGVTWEKVRPVAGVAVAASVAGLALFFAQELGLGPQPMEGEVSTAVVAQESTTTPLVEDVSDRYVVPMTPSNSSVFIPATRLTNYVVAHSEYSSLLGRRSVLSGVLAEGEAEFLGEAPPVSAAQESPRR